MLELTLELAGDGRVTLRRPGQASVPVTLRPCFPWSTRDRFISLRDPKGEELALVDDPEGLDDTSRRALHAGLTQSGFVLEIRSIEAVESEMEIRNWRVTTRQGPTTFQTRLDEWPRRLPDGALLLRDVAGNLYRIADPSALDAKSKRLLWAYVA